MRSDRNTHTHTHPHALTRSHAHTPTLMTSSYDIIAKEIRMTAISIALLGVLVIQLLGLDPNKQATQTIILLFISLLIVALITSYILLVVDYYKKKKERDQYQLPFCTENDYN